jgi:hypothetical protein
MPQQWLSAIYFSLCSSISLASHKHILSTFGVPRSKIRVGRRDDLARIQAPWVLEHLSSHDVRQRIYVERGGSGTIKRLRIYGDNESPEIQLKVDHGSYSL